MTITPKTPKTSKAPRAPKKLSMKQRYEVLTRDLDWEPSYVDPKEVFPTPSSKASRSTTGASGRTRSG